jgi:hypothetical protein
MVPHINNQDSRTNSKVVKAFMGVINGKINNSKDTHTIEIEMAMSTLDIQDLTLKHKKELRKYLRIFLGRKIKGIKSNRGNTNNKDAIKATKLGKKSIVNGKRNRESIKNNGQKIDRDSRRISVTPLVIHLMATMIMVNFSGDLSEHLCFLLRLCLFLNC